jgi:hypothetical protein
MGVAVAVGIGVCVGVGVGGGAVAVGDGVFATVAVAVPERGLAVRESTTVGVRWAADVGVGVAAARTVPGAAMLTSSQPMATMDDGRIFPD